MAPNSKKMMRRARPLSWVLVCAALMGASPAWAGVGAHLGHVRANDAKSGSSTIGGHIEFALLPILAVRADVDYRHVETLDVGVPGQDGEVEVRSFPVTATARLYFPTGPTFRLFASAGAGWYFLRYDYSGAFVVVEDDSDASFGWHLGGGLQWELSASVALYGEVRGIFVDPDRSFDEDLANDVEEFDYDSVYMAVGVTLGL